MAEPVNECLPPPLTVPVRGAELNALLDKEWLVANKIGAYSSSTTIGCNTRRYHALLVAATIPPVGRVATLSTVMEQMTVGETTYDLATNEFHDAFSPRGFEHQEAFVNAAAPAFHYRVGRVELVKEIILSENANAVAIRYTVRGGSASLKLWPFAALRDFHHLRKVHQPHHMTFSGIPGGVLIEDRMQAKHSLHIVSNECVFEPRPQWWYRFCYRGEIARGQEGFEDLYTPGCFTVHMDDGGSCQLTASLDQPIAVDAATTIASRRARRESLAAGLGPKADAASRTLAAATDAFVVMRDFPNAPPQATILAGFHWFADWGRDAFIALPGLLLTTRRLDLARQVFSTFAAHVSDGMVPNRFDDYGSAPHYNSIDASLWFIMAAEQYVNASGDEAFWRSTLMPVIRKILDAYHNGTLFDIHADSDGLLLGGSEHTQLTWMDAALGQEVITPRHGKAVEINAMWHAAHRIMAKRCENLDNSLARHYADRADVIARSFIKAFWNAQSQCLFDCVFDGRGDGAIRPNQIFAVSLPHSPLNTHQQASVLRVVTQHLLTPYGLRTLSPVDSRYRRQYGGSWESRDRAYHQGTVWAWLMGPYIEALLKVEAFSPAAVKQAQAALAAFDAHLAQAGLGYINEIFDADAPHTPRGCIAQAWSVSEVLRAKMMVNSIDR